MISSLVISRVCSILELRFPRIYISYIHYYYYYYNYHYYYYCIIYVLYNRYILSASDKVAPQLGPPKWRKTTREILGRAHLSLSSGKGGSVLIHVGTNNVEREGTTVIVRKYRNLVTTLKQTWVEQVILSGMYNIYQ